jgi:hypothetical protein
LAAGDLVMAKVPWHVRSVINPLWVPHDQDNAWILLCAIAPSPQVRWKGQKTAERLGNPADVPAKIALDNVSRIWRRPAEERFNQVDRLVLLENRIEVLQQAAALLGLSQKTWDWLSQ